MSAAGAAGSAGGASWVGSAERAVTSRVAEVVEKWSCGNNFQSESGLRNLASYVALLRAIISAARASIRSLNRCSVCWASICSAIGFCS